MTYLPPHFQQDDSKEIERFLATHPLATIVVTLDGQLRPSHIPLIFKSSDTGNGTFIGHVALANDMWRAGSDQDVLIIVTGPDAYVTPNWYPTKAESHEVVPTWNYAAVHAWGRMVIHHEAKWKRMAVGMLTQIYERRNEIPWKMGDAPHAYIDGQLEHIVGIEIPVDRLIAKYKLNQNRTAADRKGVIAGLGQRDSGGDAALREMMINTGDDQDSGQ